MGQLPRARTTAWRLSALPTPTTTRPRCSSPSSPSSCSLLSRRAPARSRMRDAQMRPVEITQPADSPCLSRRWAQKKYYLGIFFKANWYKAEQYCRFHGMHLASINSDSEQRNLQEHIQSFGMGHEHFWTSGTDQGEESKFFWMSTGKPRASGGMIPPAPARPSSS